MENTLEAEVKESKNKMKDKTLDTENNHEHTQVMFPPSSNNPQFDTATGTFEQSLDSSDSNSILECHRRYGYANTFSQWNQKYVN